MGDKTKIEWTEATWNPVHGCSKVSPGCDHCYAESIATRFAGTAAYPDGFAVTLRPERLGQPLRWSRPRRIFVCSMADLFHDEVPDEHIAKVFAVMAAAEQHTFQVLTKRHGRMRALLRDPDFHASVWQWCVEMVGEAPALALWGGSAEVPWPLPNVWVGVSAEDQHWAEVRVPALLETPAAVRWVSAEPLLGAIDLRRLRYRGGVLDALAGDYGNGTEVYAAAPSCVQWVVAGGESGAGARPMHPQWARDLRDQCAATSRAFLFKQWGQYAPPPNDGVHRGDVCLSEDGTAYVADHRYVCAPNESDGEWLRRYSKLDAGRDLDGRTHDGYPVA